MTSVGRGWRWCRRNPAVAALSFSTLAALVLAAVFIPVTTRLYRSR